MFGTHPFVRFINQNRRQIRITIIVILVFFVFIQILNSLEKKKIENITKEENEVGYSYLIETEKQNVVKSFLNYCKLKDESNAYALLSLNAKKIYKTEGEFNSRFLSRFFTSNKAYSFSNKTENVYLVKINEDVLATGKLSSNVEEESFNIILEKENNNYKIKIN